VAVELCLLVVYLLPRVAIGAGSLRFEWERCVERERDFRERDLLEREKLSNESK